jgi:putative membrane protein
MVIATVLVNRITPLKRVLVPRRRMVERALVAARSHFVEQGISVTRDRSGILVYVSLLERTACVVADVGIDQSKLGEAWIKKLAELEGAVRREDPAAFAATLKELGPILEGPYPVREDDVNELPDAPDMGDAAQ